MPTLLAGLVVPCTLQGAAAAVRKATVGRLRRGKAERDSIRNASVPTEGYSYPFAEIVLPSLCHVWTKLWFLGPFAFVQQVKRYFDQNHIHIGIAFKD